MEHGRPPSLLRQCSAYAVVISPSFLLPDRIRTFRRPLARRDRLGGRPPRAHARVQHRLQRRLPLLGPHHRERRRRQHRTDCPEQGPRTDPEVGRGVEAEQAQCRGACNTGGTQNRDSGYWEGRIDSSMIRVT